MVQTHPAVNGVVAGKLSLPRLEASIGLVDDVDAALAPDDTVVPVALDQRFDRIPDLHGSGSLFCPARAQT
jgi:hypothetical protein